MCDDFIDPAKFQDFSLSRRAFGLTAVAAAGVATSARAAVAVVEKDVDVKTPDGIADSALFYPEGKGAWPAVLLWTDNMSLRPVFREMGRRLAGEGYVVLIPNVYYRGGRGPLATPGAEETPEQRAAGQAKLQAMRAAITPEGTMKDAAAMIAFLDAQPQTDKRKKAGVQGYCMGGPLAFRTAAAVPGRIGAVASFHGGGLASAQPNSPHLLIPTTKAEYLVLIADNDDQRDPASKDTLKAAFTAAGKPHKVEVYAGAQHGWTVKGGRYSEPLAEKAWAELLALYKRTLV